MLRIRVWQRNALGETDCVHDQVVRTDPRVFPIALGLAFAVAAEFDAKATQTTGWVEVCRPRAQEAAA